jgi:ABC-type uncharacterized transport system auxiliary subunit
MTKHHLFLAPLLLVFLALTGCSFVTSGDVQQNYVLPVPTLEVKRTTLPLHLKVMPVEVASGLDTTRIALIENDVQINYFADSRWAEPLPQMLQFLWIQALRQSGLATSVSGDTEGTKADRLIHITASAFNAVRKDEEGMFIRIHYEAKVTSPLTHAVLSVEDSAVEQILPSSSMESVMQTFNSANAQAMHNLLKKLSSAEKK